MSPNFSLYSSSVKGPAEEDELLKIALRMLKFSWNPDEFSPRFDAVGSEP